MESADVSAVGYVLTVVNEPQQSGPRVDPRPAQTRDLVLQAARMIIISEGQTAVTPTKLAEVSGVAKSTIYRYWPDAGAVIADATQQEAERLPVRRTGDLEADLRAFLEGLRDLLSSPGASIIVAQADIAEREEAAADSLAANGDHRREVLREMLDDPRGGFADTHAQLIGPLFMQRFFTRRPITDELITSIVDDYLASRGDQ